jgi:hypothetical protein
MSTEPDTGRETAHAVEPFLAERYCATGEDLADVAATDRILLGLASLYTRLPGLVQQAAEAGVRIDVPARSALRGRELCREANSLPYETAQAIRCRLRVLAARAR